jgi:hypothetical protein
MQYVTIECVPAAQDPFAYTHETCGWTYFFRRLTSLNALLLVLPDEPSP